MGWGGAWGRIASATGLTPGKSAASSPSDDRPWPLKSCRTVVRGGDGLDQPTNQLISHYAINMHNKMDLESCHLNLT